LQIDRRSGTGIMDSRQRCETALAHKEPDRVPIDYWATAEVSSRLMRHLGFSCQEELLTHLDVDFRYIAGPEYIGPKLWESENGSLKKDLWGVERVKVELASGGSYWEVHDFPLAGANSLEELKDYAAWPDPDWFDYGCVRDQIAEARSKGKMVVFMGDRINRIAQLKPAMYLRGIEQILVDIALNPEIADYIFTRIAEFYLEYAGRTFEAAGKGIDIFMMGDDFGTQNGEIVSPQMWRDFLLPGFKEYIKLGKSHGYRVAHHSCGSIKAIIEDMVDCGLDILNPLQPDVHGMDRRELKKRFGEILTFHGSISIQKTMPYGTAEQIRNEVQERFETLGPGGGFIFCTAHNIQSDTPVENVITLFEAYSELGRYSAH